MLRLQQKKGDLKKIKKKKKKKKKGTNSMREDFYSHVT